MDANGLRFWMVADGNQWFRPGDPPALEVEDERRHLRLARRRPPRPPETAAVAPGAQEAAARSLLERVPMTRDRFGTWAYWDPGTGSIRATGALSDAIDLLWPEAAPTDLVMGHDGVLHLAVNGAVLLIDARGRWPMERVSHPDCVAWRLAAHPRGGVWVLDRTHRALWRLTGSPLPAVAASGQAEDPLRLRACEPNRHPPRLDLTLSEVIPSEETVAGLATSLAGRVALLSWRAPGGAGVVRLPLEEGGGGAIRLEEAPFPWTLAWLSEERLALRSPAMATEAPVFALPRPGRGFAPEGLALRPLGDFHPLQRAVPEPEGPPDPWLPGPFVHGLTLPPHYPRRRELADQPPPTAPLDVLPLPTHTPQGEAFAMGPEEAAQPSPPSQPRQPFCDSGEPGTVWHRLYLEAAIPATGGIVVELAASDAPGWPAEACDWHAHRFGERFLPGDGQVPVGTWLAAPSERPFHPGVLACERRPGRSGLFTALVQQAGRRVRRLQGRYLWLRVRLSGDGCASPELAAVRVYGSRFSYRDRYLPELYQENAYGDEGETPALRSTPADFLERFLAIGEGVLTPLEDQIAQAFLLTTASTAPAEALDWLGSWIGVSLDPGWSTERRRRWLDQTPELYRRRGTRAGLELALDIASDGGVSQGAILVLEDFRLRRTFATILGADLADEEDPLLGGWAVSRNSVVGDTLILGEEGREEILALFGVPAKGWSGSERESVDGFYARFAHRATVLVHDQMSSLDLGLIRRVVALETPAHVATQVVSVNHPLLVGVSSLVGIDTFLRPSPPSKRVKLDHSRLNRALLESPASLDPRLERGIPARLGSPRPVAQLSGPEEVDRQTSFRLDGSPSRAGPGHKLSRYRWQRLE